MKLPKSIMRGACALILALVLGTAALAVTAVIYGLATACPNVAVYVKCS